MLADVQGTFTFHVSGTMSLEEEPRRAEGYPVASSLNADVLVIGGGPARGVRRHHLPPALACL